MVFLTVEGLDGAGGTTLVGAITERYPDAVTTAEPSGRQYGRLVRENLSIDHSDPIVDFFLFMADRRDHIEEVIKPAAAKNKLIVSDRYADSTRVYQPVALSGEGKPFESSWQAKFFIENAMTHWNYEPDLTLYLDISVDTALERADEDEKYEDREFLEQVKENYDALADTTDRIVRIDGEQSKEEVVASAVGKIDVVAPDRL